MPHVVLLLKSDVDDGLRDWLSDPFQELGLSDDDLQLGGKVNSVVNVFLVLFVLQKDGLVELVDGLVGVFVTPLIEDLLLVFLIELLRQLHVLVSDLAEGGAHQLVRLVLELLDGSLDPSHDRSCPSDLTGLWRHVLGDRRIVLIVEEQVLILSQFLLVSLQDVIVLVVENNFDLLSRLDILELLEKVECSLGRVQLVLEGPFNQAHDVLIDLLDLLAEVVESALPESLILVREDVSVEGFKLFYLLLYFVDLVVNLLWVARNLLEVWAKNGIEFLDDDACFFKVAQDIPHVD